VGLSSKRTSVTNEYQDRPQPHPGFAQSCFSRFIYDGSRGGALLSCSRKCGGHAWRWLQQCQQPDLQPRRPTAAGQCRARASRPARPHLRRCRSSSANCEDRLTQVADSKVGDVVKLHCVFLPARAPASALTRCRVRRHWINHSRVFHPQDATFDWHTSLREPARASPSKRSFPATD